VLSAACQQAGLAHLGARIKASAHRKRRRKEGQETLGGAQGSSSSKTTEKPGQAGAKDGRQVQEMARGEVTLLVGSADEGSGFCRVL